jgi:hypothetical protein
LFFWIYFKYRELTRNPKHSRLQKLSVWRKKELPSLMHMLQLPCVAPPATLSSQVAFLIDLI